MRPPRRLHRIEVWMKIKDADKLKRARRRANYTQTDLARLVDVKQQYISAMETGVDRDCSDKVAERICRYLDVDLEDYFEAKTSSRMPAITSASRLTGSAA